MGEITKRAMLQARDTSWYEDEEIEVDSEEEEEESDWDRAEENDAGENADADGIGETQDGFADFREADRMETAVDGTEKGTDADDAGGIESLPAGETSAQENAAPDEPDEQPRRSITDSQTRGRRISGELLFENDFSITEDIYYEFSKAFMGQYSRIYYVLGAFCLVMGVVSGAMFLLMAVICLALPTFMARSSRKKKYKHLVEQNGGKPLERRVLFYSDALEVFANSGAHTVFGYEDITKVISAKSIYVLVIQKRTSLLVSQKGFQKGSLEEWKAFLGTKGKWKIR